MRYLSVFIFGLSLCCASTAFAENHAGFFGNDSSNDTSANNKQSASQITPITQGVYLGGAVGYGHESADSASNSGFAGGIDAGYQFNQNIGAEAGFTYLPSSSAALGSFASGKTNFYLFDIAAKPMVYVNNRFSIYGKFGIAIQAVSSSVSVGLVNANASDNYGALYLGGGLAYNITNQCQIVGDLASSIGSQLTTFSAMGGINYIFAAQ